MLKKTALGIMLVLYLLGSLNFSISIPARAEPGTWTVDDDGPADFHTIQEAINHANPGDTIYVYNGNYYENVVVNKSLLLVGENRATTFIDGMRLGTVVNITASNVVLRKFTIKNSGNHTTFEYGLPDSGILILASTNVTVDENTCSDNSFAILSLLSEDIEILNNTVNDNGIGVLLYASDYATLRGNNLTKNEYNFGVIPGTFLAVPKLGIFHNIDGSNTVDGKPIYYFVNQSDNHVPVDAGYVAIINSNNIAVQELNVTKNISGILLAYTNNSIIKNVYASNNGYGILLICSNSNVIEGNILSNNYGGIYLCDSSNYNMIHGNNITSNMFGFYLSELSSRPLGNVIYHNDFVNNTYQGASSDFVGSFGGNIWDNGYPYGGNYWSDYTGVDLYSDLYQNNTGSDGIGDTPYMIDENNVDNYPLIGPYSSFNTGVGYSMDVVSNSTVEDFEFFESNSTIRIVVSNMTANQTFGFCRLTIPHTLIAPPYNITVNNNPVNYTTIFQNENISIIYFSYQHSTLEIIITPEFPSALILPLFTLPMLIVVFTKKKHSKQKT